jgi:hypothetical protein
MYTPEWKSRCKVPWTPSVEHRYYFFQWGEAMPSKSETLQYLHGFSPKEQERLRQQAAFAEQSVFRNVEFGRNEKILEVGCGVGAQSEILSNGRPEPRF